ncbi:MAG: isoleucine--tRNA ligase [Verrucomicrobiota bacterium]
MDYKNTLNLPRTDFPMKADLVQREPQRLAKWEKENLYGKIQEARKDAPKFILHDGPPFANGDVHIGTALNKILKDIIIKYKTLRGFSAPYVPGWDCHGLPIEFKVMQNLRKSMIKDISPTITEQDLREKELSSDTFSAVMGEFAEAVGDEGISKLASIFPATAIREACEVYARKFIDLQRTQFKRLGILGDWENPYLTLNKEYEADELRLFADIVEQGFVYRGKKPVYWSIPCRTALAEAEVEYHDHVSQSVFVKFPVVGKPGTNIVIWTTTPWTLPANLAVAYNSTFSYSLIRTGDETYIVATLLLANVAEKCGWQTYEIVRSLAKEDLAPLQYQHPFCNRTGKLFAGDNFVTSDTGTGFVHIAPGHGLDDYNLGRQNNLPIYSPVNDDGALAYTSDLPIEQQMPAELVGKSILEKHGKSDANVAVLHELRVRNALIHQENYHHSYPFCWRSKTPVIFRAMNQWFIKIDHTVGTRSTSSQISSKKSGNAVERVPTTTFRATALDEINRVHWIPDWGKSRIEGAVKSRPDWCISRQRTWGVPIPAFYDAQGEGILDAEIVRNTAKLIEQHGSNVWFEKSAGELWSLVKPANWNGAEPTAKSNDTLDVWIDSGSSSRAVLMRRTELHHNMVGTSSTSSPISSEKNGDAVERVPTDVWQADVYLEGSDQHRGWFQSSLLLSLAGNGVAPYKTVLTHGFMVDADKEKISKSKQGAGAYEKPQTADAYVNKYGADIVRLWVASQDYRNDIVVSEERIAKVAETYRGIRNTLRYQLSNLYDFDPEKHTVADEKLTGLDRWILGEFSKIEKEIIAAYDAYEFHVVYQKISQFIAVELSSIYHDVVKDRLYTDAANSERRRSTQTALHRIVTGLCKMIAPILVFTADEAWGFLTNDASSVHRSSWSEKEFHLGEGEMKNWSTLFSTRQTLFPWLEKARQEKIIGKALDAKITLLGYSSNAFAVEMQNEELLRELLNISQLKFTFTELPDATPARIPHVGKAEGQKCERCWHWETDVGSNSEHPTICGRCVEAVKLFKV